MFFWQEANGTVPVRDWLETLRRRGNRKAVVKLTARIQALAEHGNQLRRPQADILRDGIYELRARVGRVNYRLLYFFHGQAVAIVAHGLAKEAEVPARDIETAKVRRALLEKDPKSHIHAPEDGCQDEEEEQEESEDEKGPGG